METKHESRCHNGQLMTFVGALFKACPGAPSHRFPFIFYGNDTHTCFLCHFSLKIRSSDRELLHCVDGGELGLDWFTTSDDSDETPTLIILTGILLSFLIFIHFSRTFLLAASVGCFLTFIFAFFSVFLIFTLCWAFLSQHPMNWCEWGFNFLETHLHFHFSPAVCFSITLSRK